MWTENNTQEQLIAGVIKHGPEILEHCLSSDDLSKYINRITEEHLDYPQPNSIISTNWFIPDRYQSMDIESYCLGLCNSEEEKIRTKLELVLYQKNDMIIVLKTMKYIVDTLRENNIIWGVGRGSSVASYVLYLIGVHRIDSIKYNIPIEEFFKGE